MDDVFQADYLRRDQVRQAYPLVRVHGPAVTLNHWLAFACHWTRMPERRGGLVAIKDVRGYLHALFSYRIETDLCRGRLMRVSDLIVGHLAGKAIHMATMKAIERLADETGCSSVVIELELSPIVPSDITTPNVFANAGFAPCAVSFFRQESAYLRPRVVASALLFD